MTLLNTFPLRQNSPCIGEAQLGGDERRSHAHIGGQQLRPDRSSSKGGAEHSDVCQQRQRADASNAGQKANAKVPAFEFGIAGEDAMATVDVTIEEWIAGGEDHDGIVGAEFKLNTTRMGHWP